MAWSTGKGAICPGRVELPFGLGLSRCTQWIEGELVDMLGEARGKGMRVCREEVATCHGMVACRAMARCRGVQGGSTGLWMMLGSSRFTLPKFGGTQNQMSIGS